MKKHKFLIVGERTNEFIEKETAVSDDLVKRLQECLESLNSQDITVTPITINSDGLGVRWSIIEKIGDEQYLTHYISLKSVS